MKRPDREPKPPGIRTYFVQGNQAVVNVECSVLHSLGHHWTTALLELLSKLHVIFSVFRRDAIAKFQQQHFRQECEYWTIDCRVAAASITQGDCNRVPVFFRRRTIRRHVAAIYREARKHLTYGRGQLLQSEVAIVSISFG